ncbi:uncharacterized protein LOC127409893 [Myxocyprinus asiaticus]|uniref:uncharacterized protein LOC127409893 n=1 Tax=Myxocyprinus asiaticus TaxID=70543 RepID=UPI002223E645|nr:uncharacterized protein LOC127409893 [Myxocyprinus asiaticus]
MAASGGTRCRWSYRPGGTGAIHTSTAKRDGGVGTVLSGGSCPACGGPHGGDPEGRRALLHFFSSLCLFPLPSLLSFCSLSWSCSCPTQTRRTSAPETSSPGVGGDTYPYPNAPPLSPSGASAGEAPGPACWRCGDPSHFRDQCPLMELGTVLRVSDLPQAAPDRARAYRIPVSVKGGTHQALVDTGCNQTTIHQPEALVTTKMVKVKCVHGDIHKNPVVTLTIKFQGKKHRVVAAVSSRLTHPLILGTDWPDFKVLLKGICADGSCMKLGRCVMCDALAGEAEPGPSSTDPRHNDERGGEAAAPPLLREFPEGDFPLEQSQDKTLKHAFDQVRVIDGQQLQPDIALSYPYFAIINERLYRVTQDTQTKEDTTQLLIPRSRREMVFQAAHYNPMAGHLGERKTLNHLIARFYWPGIGGDVRRWCAACRECQLVNPLATPKAPLRPLPLIKVPFGRIGMDLVGPLERSARGHRFVLVLVDYATRYPEAMPLRNISAHSVAEALFKIISRVGIPKEILTDQGTTFMSQTLRELYELLNIKSIRTSVYHPQTDGLVERFNKTLKNMICKFVHDDARNWDKWLNPLLFAVREVPQASTGFSPFDLLYGRHPRGVLDVLREAWEEEPSNSKNEIQYVQHLRRPPLTKSTRGGC